MSKDSNTNETLQEIINGVVYTEDEINEIITNIHNNYPNTSIKRVCACGRVSTKQEEQKSSLVTQHEVFKSYCANHMKDGYVLVKEVYEQRSGTLLTKRKIFQQIIEEARQGEYDILLFKSSSRFSRNTSDFLDLVESLKREQIYLVFVSENVNTEFADRQTLTMLGMMNESYSNSLHDSVSTSIKIRQNSELGRVPGNVFGYHRHTDNTSLADIVPEQAELLNELFSRYRSGEGIASICKDWQSRGIKTYNNNTISMFALRRYIRNPLYKGVLEMGKFTKSDVRASRKRTPDENLIVRHRPDLQIIDTDLWNECNIIMDNNKRKMTKQGSCLPQTDTVKDKLFARVIKCGECGRNYNRKVSNHKKQKKYIYLMCGYKKYSKLNQASGQICSNEKVLRLDTLLSLILMYMKDLLDNQKDLRELVYEHIKAYIKKLQTSSVDKSSQKELNEAKEKLKRLGMLFKDGLVSEDEYIEQRALVKKLEQNIKSLTVMNISDAEINSLVDKFIDNMDSIMQSSLDESKEENSNNIKKFNSLFDSITVYSDHVDIAFRGLSKGIEKVNIKQLIPVGHRELTFVCPECDNNISESQVLDKLEPYSIEERQYLDSIEDKELRNKIRKKLHRKKKTDRVSIRTSEILGLDSETVINQHTNQVVSGIRDIDINLYIV